MNTRKESFPFKRGDLVKCDYDFVDERRIWLLPYPKMNQYLTVAECVEHSEYPGTYLLFFEDLRLSIPLDASRFHVVQNEVEGDNILNEAYKIANHL